MTTTPDAPVAQILYRMWDASGRLLYVGITNSFHNRFSRHAIDKEWIRDVTSVTIEHFPDRASVLAAEAAAITTEKPKHNVIRYYAGDSKLHSFRCPDDLWRAARDVAAERGEVLSGELRRFVVEYAEREH